MDELIRGNVEINDLSLFSSKGLVDADELNSKYFTLYRNYKVLLDRYLVDKLKLADYDQSIDNVGLKFIPEKPEDMDFYQYMSGMHLKYLYLRNNLYVEKLSNEDIDKILVLTDDDLSKPSPEIVKLVEDTYKSVIDLSPKDDGAYMTRYGPDNDRFWFPSNELIIGLRYDMFADNGLGEDDEWAENNDKQIEFIGNLMEELGIKSSGLLGIPVNVVLYTDFTIKEAVNIKR